MKNKLNYVVVAVVFFLLGMVLSPSAPLVKSIRKKFLYTRGVAQRLYNKWDKDDLIFAEDEKSFAEFSRENEKFIVYFWATWCPYCRDVTDVINLISMDAEIPLVALTFDDDKKKLADYRSEKEINWRNIVKKSDSGWEFVKRENQYNIPLIPSVWLLENGKVKRIFVGSDKIKEIPDFLINENLMKSGAEPIFD